MKIKWNRLEDCDRGLKAREAIVGLCRDGGATVEDDAFIAACFEPDGTTLYAIEDANDYVFWDFGLFTPDRRDELIAEIEAMRKQKED